MAGSIFIWIEGLQCIFGKVYVKGFNCPTGNTITVGRTVINKYYLPLVSLGFFKNIDFVQIGLSEIFVTELTVVIKCV